MVDKRRPLPNVTGSVPQHNPTGRGLTGAGSQQNSIDSGSVSRLLTNSRANNRGEKGGLVQGRRASRR